MSDLNSDQPRRDFLYVATASVGVVATGTAIWPLVNQMNPSADVRALSRIQVDISDVAPGTQLTVSWRGKPVFIRPQVAADYPEPGNFCGGVNFDAFNRAGGRPLPRTDLSALKGRTRGRRTGKNTRFVPKQDLGICAHVHHQNQIF